MQYNEPQLLCIWDFQTCLNHWNLFLHSDIFQRALKILSSYRCCALGTGVKPYSGCSCPSLWLCITTSALQLRSLPVTYKIADSCNTSGKEAFRVWKLYLWPLRATAGKEGLLTFSGSHQTAAWRLDCRNRWWFQWLPVETAVSLLMSCKIWLLLCLSSVYWAKNQYTPRWVETEKVCGFHAQVAGVTVRVNGTGGKGEQSPPLDTKVK